jgi:hypothetical protein
MARIEHNTNHKYPLSIWEEAFIGRMEEEDRMLGDTNRQRMRARLAAQYGTG